MNNLKDKILNKIEKGEIKKTSKWYFLGKKYILWTLFIFSLLFGAISFAILLKNTFDDFGPWYELKIKENFLFSNIIWIWIGTMILFLFSASIHFKKTRKGFKYTNIYIILISLVSSLILGFIFYQIHLGHYIEHGVENHSQKYLEIKQEKMKKILEHLEENNIDKNEFFKNKRILKIKEIYKKVDAKRIERLENILKNNKNLKNIDEIKNLFNEIKNKKRELDYKRILLLIQEYKKE